MGREKQVIGELLDVLESIAEGLWPSGKDTATGAGDAEDNEEDEDEDLDKQLANELAAIRKPNQPTQRFSKPHVTHSRNNRTTLKSYAIKENIYIDTKCRL
ncbi:hypothetical protein FRB95_004446 [Tulasnella sp. JGI-2019a]|nr:hypothetical protein FRB95_004446 [Tulasnella sp. JGI-2019a]